MKDKDVKELLYRYADKRNDINEDLAKFNTLDGKPASKKRRNAKIMVALFCLVLILVITLTVLLYPRQAQKTNPIYYASDSNVVRERIESIDEFNSRFNKNVQGINAEALIARYDIMHLSDTQKVIGAKLEYYLAVDDIETIEMIAYIDNYRISEALELAIDKTIVVDGQKYGYFIEEKDENRTTFYVSYSRDGVEYRCTINTYKMVEITHVIKYFV